MWFRKKKKVGLVLGSGGARGLAHIGVINKLIENEIPIDLVTGASSGALIGGFYAAEGSIQKIEQLIKEVNYSDLVGVLADPVWGAGLIGGGRTIEYLKKNLGERKIEDCKVPYAAVATDVRTAETVIFDKGDLISAIRASISLPLVYTPVKFGQKILVDGGVSSPVPVEVAKQMGADILIAVNLDSVYFGSKKKEKNYSSSTIEILKDSYYALRYNLAKKEVRQADILIEPDMPYVADFEFIQGKQAITAGEKATTKLIEQIKKLL